MERTHLIGSTGIAFVRLYRSSCVLGNGGQSCSGDIGRRRACQFFCSLIKPLPWPSLALQRCWDGLKMGCKSPCRFNRNYNLQLATDGSRIGNYYKPGHGVQWKKSVALWHPKKRVPRNLYFYTLYITLQLLLLILHFIVPFESCYCEWNCLFYY